MAHFTEDEYNELKRNLDNNRKALAKHKRGAERVASVPKDVRPIERNANGTEYAGTSNVCPECGAYYDVTEHVDGNRCKRQWTRNEGGVDFDYFECFCKPSKKLTRYK